MSLLVTAIFLTLLGVIRLGFQVMCRVSSFLHALIWLFSCGGRCHALPSLPTTALQALSEPQD